MAFNIIHIHGISKKSILFIIFGKIFFKKIILKLTNFNEDDFITIKKRSILLFYIGSDISYTNYKIVNTICKYLKLNTKQSIEFIDDRPYNDSRYAIDYQKIK